MLRQIAVVNQSAILSRADLLAGTAALQRQVSRDLSQHWSITATVDPFDQLLDVPVGYWPIVIMDKINRPQDQGYHTDDHGQPFAVVEYASYWTLTVSHELIEMLIDPFGKTLVAGNSPDPEHPGRVQYLVEACDPCEDPGNAYDVNGFPVSDFYTPRYFDPTPSQGVQYSANSRITEPRQILPGGYITWHNATENSWYQATYFGALEIRSLGQIGMGGKSLREQIHRNMEGGTAMQPSEDQVHRIRMLKEHVARSTRANGQRLARDLGVELPRVLEGSGQHLI